MKKICFFLAMVIILLTTTTGDPKVYADSNAIVYDFGSAGIAIPAGLPAQVNLTMAEYNMMVLDQSLVRTYVDNLASQYNASDCVMDTNYEEAYLKGVIAGTQPAGVHTPTFHKVTTTTQTNKSDNKYPYIANLQINKGTYVYISIANQELVYFVNGVITIQTPVVTGNVSRNHDTPTGTFKVNAKQTNRILKGPGYRSHVNYWMPVYKGVGIHDASWRSSFGGEIYKTSGSHGCINVPTDVMPTIYNSVPKGTPVIIS